MRGCQNCGGALYTGSRPYQIDELVCRACQKSPAVQVHMLLRRARSAGYDFDYAWQFALGEPVLRDGEPDFVGGRVRWPHDTTHRKEWKAVFWARRHRDEWRECYIAAAVEDAAPSPLADLALIAA